MSYNQFAASGISRVVNAVEFELAVAAYLENLGKELPDFKVTHNARLSAADGVYQIDVHIKYRVLGADMQVLVECKRHAKSIPRETVQILHDKLRSINAQKAMLFSTSGFQDGAIQYALRHKIALVVLINDRFAHVTNSLNRPLPKTNAVSVYPGEFISENEPEYISAKTITPLLNYLYKMTY